MQDAIAIHGHHIIDLVFSYPDGMIPNFPPEVSASMPMGDWLIFALGRMTVRRQTFET